MADYASFRQRLDAVLRTRDVKQVQDFLIAEKQWQSGQPADPEYAMWMMIAGSPTLKDLHDLARKWLLSHGRAEDVDAILKRGKGTGQKQKQGKSEARYPVSKKGKLGSNPHPTGPQKNRKTNGH